MKKVIFSIAACALLISSCATTRKMSNQDKGVAIGAGSGAVVGGVIGRVSGNTGLGAIIGAAVGGVTGGVIGHRMDKQAEEIRNKVPDAKVERVGEGIVVTFGEGVLFAKNQSSLNAQSYNTLNKLVTVLNGYSDTNLEIDGHTDNTGAAAYNQTLSEKRAGAVSDYLRAQRISSARIVTRGFGEQYPKADNNTEAGRAENRRVEFQITANDQMKQDAQREAGR